MKTSDAPRPRPVVARYAPVAAIVAVIALVPLIADGIRGHAPSTGVPPAQVSALPLTPETARAQQRSVDFGPTCDLSTGRVRLPSAYAPPCVPPFHADNGGRTAQGVTGDTITVAVYQAAPDLLQEGILAAGGGGDNAAQSARTLQDYVTLFEDHYQTYGRHVRLVNVDASGGAADDAAARADAIRVAAEIKAFASFGGPSQTDAYAQELAARHVLCIGCATGMTDARVRSLAPYVWGVQPSPEQANVLTAEYVGKRLKGQPAGFAGDPALQRKPRVFGLLAYDTPSGTFGPVRDNLTRELAGYGVTVAATGTYLLDVSQAQELARTLITKMKSVGVTSIIFDGDPFAPVFLTQEATRQNYFPEWIVTGSVLTDTSAFARLYDQRQWAHAFGLSELSGRVKEQDSDPYRLHVWQFGSAPPAPSSYPLIYVNPFLFFLGVHLAGPDLTADSYAQAMWSYPLTGGDPTVARLSFGRHGIWTNDDYLGFDDAVEIWWDPHASGQDEIGRAGTGLYRYVDEGRRYLPGTWPSTPAAPFRADNSVAIFSPPPLPAYPSPAGARGTTTTNRAP